MMRFARTAAVVAAAVVSACAGLACGGTVDLGGFDRVAADGGPDATRPLGDASEGPIVEVRLRATQAPVPTQPGTAGQTPITQSLGILSLALYAGEADPAPLVVFDQATTGASGVECSLDDKAETALARVPVKKLKSGRYTKARVGVAYAKFSVRGRAHVAGFAVDGRYDTLYVLTSGAAAFGAQRDQGYSRTVFTATGQSPVTTEGTQPLPVPPQSGLVKLVQEGGAGFYDLPVDLGVDTAVSQDLASVLEVNTYENYRWTDQALPGYETGVWDTTSTSFEPVVSFGLAAAKLSFEPLSR